MNDSLPTEKAGVSCLITNLYRFLGKKRLAVFGKALCGDKVGSFLVAGVEDNPVVFAFKYMY